MARPAAVAGALLLIAGGAAIGYAVTREAAGGMSPEQMTAMNAAIAQLDQELARQRSEVHGRVATLSGVQLIRRVITTDAETIADLVTRGELANLNDPSAKDKETVEIGRVDAGKKAERLLLLPAGAMAMSYDGVPGAYAELVANQVAITEVARVLPEQGDTPTGFLSVTRTVALEPAIAALVRARITGKLVIRGKEAPIGTMPAGTPTREHALTALAIGDAGGEPQTAKAQEAKIIVAEPPAHAIMPLPILVGGAGAAVLGLVLLAVGVRSRRAPLPVPEPALSRATPPPGFAAAVAETQLSQSGVAAGTPVSVDPASGPRLGGPSNLGPGAMIGRWEVVRRLGSGGMADVYLAQSKGEAGFEKLVAIKVMHTHLARNQRAVDHFLDEARLAARIHHPNVVAIQDLGKIGEDYVIVMEYVDGVDLERLLTSARQGGRAVPVSVGLGILCRICDGLEGAHRASSPDGTPLGIVHRDVKSANVLVSRQGIVKLVDFGIAKAATQVHLTIAGETKGTPSMMAPEQRVGEQVDVRADVYSAGAVGYELLTGREVNLDLAALAHLGIDNWPHLPPPTTQRPGLPPELDALLLSSMAWERERRPADAAAFGALCEAVVHNYNLAASDKDIARWVDAELRHLSPAYGGTPASLSKSPPV